MFYVLLQLLNITWNAQGKSNCIHSFTPSIIPPPWCSKIPYHFLPDQRSSFRLFIFRLGLLVTNHISYPLSENILIFPFYSWGSFCGIQNFQLTLFFQTWKMLCCSLLASMVSGKKSTHVFPPHKVTCHFALAAFKIVFFSFQKFVVMLYLGMDFFGFNPYRIHSASWFCRLGSSAIWGKFAAMISVHAFSVLPSFSSPSGTLMTWILDLMLQPAGSEALFDCFLCVYFPN